MSAFAPSTIARPRRGRKPTWPRIRPVRERSGAVSYRVDAGRFGGRKRLVRQFPTLPEAELFAHELRGQRATQREADRIERTNRAVSLANLTDTQRSDILAAFRLLAGTRGTLTGAVDFWRKHAAPANASTVAQVKDELIDAATRANRRPRTIYELKNKLASFVEEFGDAPAAQVTTPDISRWLDARTDGLTARSRGAYRQALHRLFAFAVRRGYRDTNPVAALEKPHAEETTPEVLKPAEVRRLLAAAQKHQPRLVPWLAIAFFAGLRTAELAALDWGRIDLRKRLIFVDARTAKKRRSRFVKIEPNLFSWLAPHARDEGAIYCPRRALRVVRAAARVRWPHNAARHSFGSYHLAAFEDAGRTAAQMGHAGDTATLFGFYRAVVRPEDARAYWNIRPKPEAVIPFPMSASGGT